jgi:hypothetical protein
VRIDYRLHADTASEIAAAFPGLRPEQLPDGMGWAVEVATISTHNGTHVDAPWHYHPTADGGARAATIDELPLDWFVRPASSSISGTCRTGTWSRRTRSTRSSSGSGTGWNRSRSWS